MAVSETNADFKIDGKLQVTNVPNRVGAFVTLDSSNNTVSHRTASEVVADLGLNNLPIPVASSTVLGGVKIGSNLTINQDGVLSATDTNTTYSTATLEQLTTGTDTTGRLQTAKNMNDWLNIKSVFAQTTGGGIKTNIWTSNALSPYSIALGHTTSAGGLGAISLGYGVTTLGTGSTNNGYQSTINGNFSSNLGSFNGINASKATNMGIGLINDQEGCTIVGRFNAPVGSLDYDTDTNNGSKKVFVVGSGKDADSRKNVMEVTADNRTKFTDGVSYDVTNRNSIVFTPTTLIDKKYFDENIPQGGGGSGNKLNIVDGNFENDDSHNGVISSNYLSTYSNSDVDPYGVLTVMMMGKYGEWSIPNDSSRAVDEFYSLWGVRLTYDNPSEDVVHSGTIEFKDLGNNVFSDNIERGYYYLIGHQDSGVSYSFVIEWCDYSLLRYLKVQSSQGDKDVVLLGKIHINPSSKNIVLKVNPQFI